MKVSKEIIKAEKRDVFSKIIVDAIRMVPMFGDEKEELRRFIDRFNKSTEEMKEKDHKRSTGT